MLLEKATFALPRGLWFVVCLSVVLSARFVRLALWPLADAFCCAALVALVEALAAAETLALVLMEALAPVPVETLAPVLAVALGSVLEVALGSVLMAALGPVLGTAMPTHDLRVATSHFPTCRLPVQTC